MTITETRVEIGANRSRQSAPEELNSDKNETAIEQFVRITFIFEMTSWKYCVILLGAKLLTIKREGVSVNIYIKYT